MKYPRYSREQNLACKLSDTDIKEIKRIRKLGLIAKDIAKIFNVSKEIIYYWLMSIEQRRQRIRRHYLAKDKEKDRESKKTRQLKSYYRKIKLLPKFSQYLKQYKNQL